MCKLRQNGVASGLHFGNGRLFSTPPHHSAESPPRAQHWCGSTRTTTHCSGGPCSADSAHVCFFLVLGLDARINHPGVFIVGVRLLVSSSISAIHCCPHLSKLRLWKSC